MITRKDGDKSTVKRYFQPLFSEQTEIDYWESVYARQDFIGDCYRRRMSQALSWLDAAKLSKGSIILDAGCGAGIVTQEIAERGYQVWGMDRSSGMVERAHGICKTKEKLNVQFLQGDIQCLPFRDLSLSSIVCLGVITYLRSEDKALREFSRVLKPHGTLILSIVNRAHLRDFVDLPQSVRRRLQRALSRRSAFGSNRGQMKVAPATRSYFIPKLRSSLERQGFTGIEYTTVPLGLLTFLGREMPPIELNVKITTFLGKTSNVPLIKSFGGMCIFKARKSLNGD